MKLRRTTTLVFSASLLLFSGCGDSSEEADAGVSTPADDGEGFGVGDSDPSDASNSDDTSDSDGATSTESDDESSDDADSDDSSSDDSSTETDDEGNSSDDASSSDDSSTDDSSTDDSSTDDSSTDDTSSDDSSSDDSSTESDDSGTSDDDSTGDDSSTESDDSETSDDDSTGDDSSTEDGTEVASDLIPLAAGNQAVEVEGINFQVSDEFIVIQDPAELAELTSSDEFREGLEQIDLGAIENQLSIVDLIAIKPTAGTFATNMNVITAPVPSFINLDQLIAQNRVQLEQVGFQIVSDEVVTTRAGDTWMLAYSIPNTEAQVVSALWLHDGTQVQVTSSAATLAEAEELLETVLQTVSQ